MWQSGTSLLTFQRNVFCCHLHNWRVSQVSNHHDANKKLSSHTVLFAMSATHTRFVLHHFQANLMPPHISMSNVDVLHYSVAIKFSWKLCNMTNAAWEKMSETAWGLSLQTVLWYSLIHCIKSLKFCLWMISRHCPY